MPYPLDALDADHTSRSSRPSGKTRPLWAFRARLHARTRVHGPCVHTLNLACMPAAGCQPAARAADERGRAGDCGGGRGEQPRADAARLRGGGGVPAADAARQLRPLPRKVRLARLEVPPRRPGRGSRRHCREAPTLPQCRRCTGGRAPDGRPSLASHVPRPPVTSAATGALCPPRPVLPASPSAPPFPAAKDEPSADAAAAEPPSAFGRPQMCVCVPHPAPRRCTTPRRAAAKLRRTSRSADASRLSLARSQMGTRRRLRRDARFGGRLAHPLLPAQWAACVARGLAQRQVLAHPDRRRRGQRSTHATQFLFLWHQRSQADRQPCR